MWSPLKEGCTGQRGRCARIAPLMVVIWASPSGEPVDTFTAWWRRLLFPTRARCGMSTTGITTGLTTERTTLAGLHTKRICSASVDTERTSKEAETLNRSSPRRTCGTFGNCGRQVNTWKMSPVGTASANELSTTRATLIGNGNTLFKEKD